MGNTKVLYAERCPDSVIPGLFMAHPPTSERSESVAQEAKEMYVFTYASSDGETLVGSATAVVAENGEAMWKDSTRERMSWLSLPQDVLAQINQLTARQ